MKPCRRSCIPYTTKTPGGALHDMFRVNPDAGSRKGGLNMLNELVNLYDSLNRLRCDFNTPYPHFRKCPKGKAAFKVSLDECGRVSDITALTDFNIEEVYRWQI